VPVYLRKRVLRHRRTDVETEITTEDTMSVYADPMFVEAEVAWRRESMAKAALPKTPRSRTHHRHLRFLNRRATVAAHGHAPRTA
jgi:hypothetical protein